MAFVRWRGNSAELLTTVYEQGRSRQVRLACLGGAYFVHPEVRAAVADRFPGVMIDWDAVDQALVEGPPHERAQAVEVPNDRLEWLQLERRLRYWAAQTEPIRPGEATRLRAAAAVFCDWRQAKPYFPAPQVVPHGSEDARVVAENPPAETAGSDI